MNLDTILSKRLGHVDVWTTLLSIFFRIDEVQITDTGLSYSSGSKDVKRCWAYFRLNWTENKMTANSPEWKKLNLL